MKEFINSKSYAYTVDLCNNLEVNPALIDSFVDNLLVHKFDDGVPQVSWSQIMVGYWNYRDLISGGKKNG